MWMRPGFWIFFAASAPDCVVDCTDTFASKYLIADAAQVAGLPLVWGTVLRFGGSVSLFEPDGAHLRDIFPTIPQTVESCALAGVLGATTAVVGSLMATEVLKYVSGLPTAAGTLLTYDALSGTCTSFGAVRIRRVWCRWICRRMRFRRCCWMCVRRLSVRSR